MGQSPVQAPSAWSWPTTGRTEGRFHRPRIQAALPEPSYLHHGLLVPSSLLPAPA